MKQFRQLKYDNNSWILQYYDEEEELIQENFTDFDELKEYVTSTLGFNLNFDPA